METRQDTEAQELAIFIEKVADRYGVDFRDYAPASFRRRVNSILSSERVPNISVLQEQVLADPLVFQRFLHSVTVSVTSMFRDPSFYLAFRKLVIPTLATYPFIRVWHAGCSTGEEAYSMAITFHEEGLLDRVRIYATDVDPICINQAKQGIYPLSTMKEYSANYLSSGGKESLSKYYIADQQHAMFSNELKSNIVFAQHNLVSDSSFNEFHVILCRNVLIYFNDVLRERVLNLFNDSLVCFGFLALGTRESMRFSDIRACYEEVAEHERIYRKIM